MLIGLSARDSGSPMRRTVKTMSGGDCQGRSSRGVRAANGAQSH
jgi:hypothetical protein